MRGFTGEMRNEKLEIKNEKGIQKQKNIECRMSNVEGKYKFISLPFCLFQKTKARPQLFVTLAWPDFLISRFSQ
jgi:hypothetical protein